VYEDALVEVHCPKCGGPITYNGNYFCQGFGQWCDWALSHGENGVPMNRVDQKVWAQIRFAMNIEE
jgi:hypothetical protein